MHILETPVRPSVGIQNESTKLGDVSVLKLLRQSPLSKEKDSLTQEFENIN